jgi:hypothetical protein
LIPVEDNGKSCSATFAIRGFNRVCEAAAEISFYPDTIDDDLDCPAVAERGEIDLFESHCSAIDQ